MRADRLVATLLLLQARGHVTAAQIAEELEVSERTARRDLDALAAAGIPLYSRQGRGGGWQLVGGARTDLSGLTATEARALFLVAGPSSSATPEMKSALRKLVHALPEPFRDQAEAASAAVVVDPASWGRPRPTPPEHLDALQHAVVAGEQVRLGYADRTGTSTERVVHPLGLVTKGSVWYLVAGTEAGRRTFRVSRVRSVAPTGDPVDRPDGFDLAEAWSSILDELDEVRAPARLRALAIPEVLGPLRGMFGTRLGVGDTGPDGRIEVHISGRDPWLLAAEIAGFGDRLEVLEPVEVRQNLARIARELTARYGDEPSAT